MNEITRLNHLIPGQRGLPVQSSEVLKSDTHCFSIFKPDAIEKGIVPEIEEAIEMAKLRILGRHARRLSTIDILEIWPSIKTPHVSRTIPYMKQGPVELLMVQGTDASEQMLDIKRTVRQRYPSDNPVVSILHTTDHDEELVRCANYFYKDGYNV